MLRQTLGDFSSIVCFFSAIVGMEDALGEKTTARQRVLESLTYEGRCCGKNQICFRSRRYSQC